MYTNEEYQSSLLTTLKASSIDDLLPKAEQAWVSLQPIPGLTPIVERIAAQTNVELDVAVLFLFSYDLWIHTSALLSDPSYSLEPFEDYLKKNVALL